jgi:hypothetical protein
MYQYGTGYLNLFVHWIPRGWWPDKPALGIPGFFPWARDEMRGLLGWEMTPGATYASAAATFLQLGFFCPAFWVAFGWFAAWLYRRAMGSPELTWRMSYVALLCAMHWFISQDLKEAFVPACIYQAGTALGLWIARAPRTVARRAVVRRMAAAVFCHDGIAGGDVAGGDGGVRDARGPEVSAAAAGLVRPRRGCRLASRGCP